MQCIAFHMSLFAFRSIKEYTYDAKITILRIITVLSNILHSLPINYAHRKIE